MPFRKIEDEIEACAFKKIDFSVAGGVTLKCVYA